jgi:uncharacterized protein YbcI
MATNGHEQDVVTPTAEPTQVDGQLTRVTRAMVGIYKNQFGRGPAHGHSHYAGADSIVCYLEGTLTPVEKSLIALGKIEQTQNIRQLFQAATEPTFRGAVEEITGRKVIAFLSGNDLHNDVVSEIFMFERQH